ncbi:HAD-IB family phosphatase [Actinacidiphila oryziradicis]|uniref:Hydrolase n=1 Tax=Actinacidiphila oryziradicis TaxID=2571141 RepID=A0A4U0SNA1_9ACTN|nr:HAD-IB family phosphatase [Actinacidiphila oryziradicis]MCW2871993.1 hydrolase [Actinacidiphila oryziradicis]TKA11454.1 hydrolase [Actinacidiphila oryziradicis]
MGRLHIFDMDGTLMYGSSANVELAKGLGLVEEFRALDMAFGAGEINPVRYAERAYGMWSSLTQDRLAAAFDGAPWLRGIREVWAEITARGEYCAVISLSPDFFVRRLLEWGVHEARASVFPEVPFPAEAVLDPAKILLPESKVTIAGELCARYGVGWADCVAYGDSMSDTVLFGTVPVSVAVNGDHHVSGLATHAYTGRDLREAYELVSSR